MHRRQFAIAAGGLALVPAWAHHGWSSFDQSRPLYLEGKTRKVAWRNPHVEFELELPAEPKLPADLAQRQVPVQASPVDGPKLLAQAHEEAGQALHAFEEFPISKLLEVAINDLLLGCP